MALPYFQAIALQTRHIVDEMNAKGHKIDSIYMSGGFSFFHLNSPSHDSVFFTIFFAAHIA